MFNIKLFWEADSQLNLHLTGNQLENVVQYMPAEDIIFFSAGQSYRFKNIGCNERQ